jgi:hypothetical protein
MNPTSRIAICLLLFLSLILHPSSLARADGGAVRLSERKGKYQITVFTAPTPLRAGPADISVMVQEAATGEPVSGVQVTIKAEHRGLPGVILCVPATTEAATNKLYHAAAVELPEPGWYSVEVEIDGPLGKAQVHFEAEIAEPLPHWLATWPWVAWPVLAILLFGMHQVLVRRKSR